MLSKRDQKIITIALFIIGALVGTYVLVHTVLFYEMHSTTARASLMYDLEAGDALAHEYYLNRYVEHDIYLFSGPIAQSYMAERYGIDSDELKQMFTNSEYEELQDFFKAEIKPNYEPV